MKKKEKDMVENFAKSLAEVKTRRPEDYKRKVSLYSSMKEGEDGGMHRNTGTTIRELHFPKWKNIHFQYLLEVLNESEKMSDEERSKLFKGDASFFKKIIEYFK